MLFWISLAFSLIQQMLAIWPLVPLPFLNSACLNCRNSLSIWRLTSYQIYVLCFCSAMSLFVTPWTVTCKAPLSMGFSRQEYRNGLPCPSPGDLPNPGMEPVSVKSPALASRFFTTSTTWEACIYLGPIEISDLSGFPQIWLSVFLLVMWLGVSQRLKLSSLWCFGKMFVIYGPRILSPL